MSIKVNTEIQLSLSSWSGGKDCCYATFQALQHGCKPEVLLNMMNENGKISRSHGLPLVILEQQAKVMNLPLVAMPTTWDNYEATFIRSLRVLKDEYNLACAVFGDIDLKPHRDWEEKVCKAAKLEAHLPLWGQDRKELLLEMIKWGIECMIVSCNNLMGEKYLGKTITIELINELEKLGVDSCGENGEYHTLVTNCPLFEAPITLPKWNTHTIDNYCFINWII